MGEHWPIILGSRSPRRLELLEKLVDPSRIEVLPPSNSDEQGFDDLATRAEFLDRIGEIVCAKVRNVRGQIASRPSLSNCFLLTCDTTVVANREDGSLIALGQPPDDNWQRVVRDWFLSYYAGKTHSVLSCVSVCSLSEKKTEIFTSVCETRVTMTADVESKLDWYLASQESPGKAGGYAIQGLASIFITQVHGSFSNVVGLPLENTMQLLADARAQPLPKGGTKP
jgi:septum formation protein